jgi:PIN domain nuclease of toxin-antitoxin system
LSLADRLCLALAERLSAEVLTADRAWGRAGRIRQIR